MERAQRRGVSVRRIEFPVEWPPGHVAAYLLDAGEVILVDAGMPGEAATFRDALAEHGYGPGDVDHLVITHPHVDHVGQVPTVLHAGDPTVYAPAGVRERFGRDPDALARRVRANAREAGLDDDGIEDAVEMAVGSLERDRGLLPPDAVDVWIEGGDRPTVGPLTVEAVHAPGHQADHLCFAADLGGERALLSGDMAVEPFRSVALHDGMDDGHREAFGAFYRALDRLAALDPDRVYPGHGPVHGAYRETLTRDRESLDRRLETVAAAVEDGPRTAAGLSAVLAGEDGRGVQYVLPEAAGALARLDDGGRVASELEDGVRRYSPGDD